MTYYVAGLPYSAELYHYGIQGQKWGLRRFQNPDGTRTPEGKIRYKTKERTNWENERLSTKQILKNTSKEFKYSHPIMAPILKGIGIGAVTYLLSRKISSKASDLIDSGNNIVIGAGVASAILGIVGKMSASYIIGSGIGEAMNSYNVIKNNEYPSKN